MYSPNNLYHVDNLCIITYQHRLLVALCDPPYSRPHCVLQSICLSVCLTQKTNIAQIQMRYTQSRCQPFHAKGHRIHNVPAP